MSLGGRYELDCAIARALDVVGERWTLLIICELFYGLRRYSELRKHIGVSPAVLTQRLNRLIEEGVVARVPGPGAHDEYELTPKGERLWPVLYGLGQWGDEHYTEPEARRTLTHHQCGTPLGDAGMCEHCKIVPPARDVVAQPRPVELEAERTRTRTRDPHRLLNPIRL
ncbi:winged helix-turn-helix transcriptional regulator [Plantactinospora soyae]|uniref:DNA-binding HxlR family transcriptional regulator n=1 Tax=Plantactinospora soyae TaxID=1544732 RepID=A0A927MCD9_9ACTN|nr:helix-turn-helix domain-containing protein [Plantactinospora soyae]MBE1489218.1 DNA-binding HxlR family transcriptional regulator [Plantactinospora soyae]